MTHPSPYTDAKKLVEPRPRFLILWIAANGIGTIVGLVVLFLIAISLGFFSMHYAEQHTNSEIARKVIVNDFQVFTPFGVFIGIMQWLVLRKHISNSGFWFLTCAIAMFLGSATNDVLSLFFQLPDMPNLFLLWFLFGSISGVLQWIILRKQISYSGLWILINIVAGGIAGGLLPDLGIIGGSIGWVMTGILTGGTLFMLLQKTNRVLNAQSVA